MTWPTKCFFCGKNAARYYLVKFDEVVERRYICAACRKAGKHKNPPKLIREMRERMLITGCINAPLMAEVDAFLGQLVTRDKYSDEA